jgi:flagellin-specific chaperone FliS
MPKVTIEVELTEERINRVIEMFEEMDETLSEMRKISQELKDLSEMAFKELAQNNSGDM